MKRLIESQTLHNSALHLQKNRRHNSSVNVNRMDIETRSNSQTRIDESPRMIIQRLRTNNLLGITSQTRKIHNPSDNINHKLNTAVNVIQANGLLGTGRKSITERRQRVFALMWNWFQETRRELEFSEQRGLPPSEVQLRAVADLLNWAQEERMQSVIQSLEPYREQALLLREFDRLEEPESTEEYERIVENARKSAKWTKKLLSKEELTAVSNYTDYQSDVNRLIRENLIDSPREKKGKKEYRNLLSALRKLHKFEGEVYRGDVLDQETVNKFKKGVLLSTKQFASTSRSKSFALGYAVDEDELDPSTDIPVLFKLIGTSGANVAGVSSEGYDGAEVLFPPNTLFKIIEVKSREKTYEDVFGSEGEEEDLEFNMVYVIMKEVSSKETFEKVLDMHTGEEL